MRFRSLVCPFSAVLLALLCACRARGPFVLRPSVTAEPRVLLDAERVLREGFSAPPAGFAWTVPEGARGRLRFSWTAAEKRGAVGLDIELEDGKGRPLRRVAHTSGYFPAGGPTAFFDVDLPISAPPGSRLKLRASPVQELLLSDLRIVLPDSRADALVLLVFDTTRRDAVGLDSCVDPSTPNLDAIFRGAFQAERAYAPASWTIPSMASLLTGRVPAVHEDSHGVPLGIAPGIGTMAEDFRRAGWSTAAFLANPTLNVGNGFATGFATFFTTPYEAASIALPGSETIRHVPSWLAAHEGEPFFLLLLLMDPHDPYTPNDRPRGQTPFDPGYTGSFVGDEIHRLQIGLLPEPSQRDIRHLAALYHDEVRLADSFVGDLWRRFKPDLGRRGTVVFTSDHGEEFCEHGGWKHGPSLFDEVLRVPFLVRPGNGRKIALLPRGTLVSLLDVLPTVESLLSLPAPARPLDGLDWLSPDARRREALPPITMLTGGPPRAAVVRRASKLFFFDRLGTRGMPDPIKDPDGFRLAKRLPDLFPAFGRYDLLADPGEKTLLPPDPATLAADWRAIERAWAGTREGLEIRILGDEPKLSLAVEGFPENARAEPFGKKADDRIAWRCRKSACTLSADLHPAGGVEGFSISGPPTDLTVTVKEGCAVLELATAIPLSSGKAQAIVRGAIGENLPRFEVPRGCLGIFLWRSTTSRRSKPENADEAVKKLRALGYLH